MPRRVRRRRLADEDRERLLGAATSGFCNICWEAIYPWQTYNWDHVIPMGLGGSRGMRNKRLTHEICNSVKANQLNFYLRTDAERQRIKEHVKPATWVRLLRAWGGHPDE